MSETPPLDLAAMWDFGDPAASEAHFLAAVKAATDDAFRAEALTQAARAQGLQRRFDEARATLAEAERIAPADSRATVRVELERGRVLNSSGSPADAMPHFAEAFNLAQQLEEDNLAVDAAHMLAIAAPSPQEQIAWGEKAIAMAEESDDPRAKRWLGPLYNNMGWSAHDAGDYEKALALFEKGVAFREAEGEPGPLRIARYTVGRALRSMGRTEEALEIQLELVEEAAAAGQPDGYFHEEAAECLHARGRTEEAKTHFAAAHELLSQDQWLVENEPERLARLGRLGR